MTSAAVKCAVIAALASITSANAQCVPPDCYPTMPALPPTASAAVRSVCGGRDGLVLVVTLINDSRIWVPGNPDIWNTELRVDGRILKPTFKTRGPVRWIEPGHFLDNVRYRADLPAGLTGTAELSIGFEPTITFNLDTLNSCPW
ncbi:MAG: hypothetical protein J0J06_10480 [Sphingomonas sp.]|uniref:hypothetical protein n=1 Tax=Sphingomonas sp. TaxID=28214 RepID=UPI001ACE27FA|nr:hypothetical protein [Sphingomonas sp.]MBN8815861.1 hypothetical protein [Sphingomonas sp.]